MNAIGIDLGGTKMEAQVFDDAWSVAARRRRDTPKDYAELVTELADLIRWADAQTSGTVPVGIGAAGLVNPQDRTCANGQSCGDGPTVSSRYCPHC